MRLNRLSRREIGSGGAINRHKVRHITRIADQNIIKREYLFQQTVHFTVYPHDPVPTSLSVPGPKLLSPSVIGAFQVTLSVI